MSELLDALSWALVAGGAFFSITGAVGLLRLPDVYCKLHAASLTDTLGATLLIGALLLQAESFAVAVKLVMIVAVVHIASPTGAYALVQAAQARGVRAPDPD